MAASITLGTLECRDVECVPPHFPIQEQTNCLRVVLVVRRQTGPVAIGVDTAP
jgi:hypothetical protein